MDGNTQENTRIPGDGLLPHQLRRTGRTKTFNKAEVPRIIAQDEESVTVRLYFRCEEYDWHKAVVKILKSEIEEM